MCAYTRENRAVGRWRLRSTSDTSQARSGDSPISLRLRGHYVQERGPCGVLRSYLCFADPDFPSQIAARAAMTNRRLVVGVTVAVAILCLVPLLLTGCSAYWALRASHNWQRDGASFDDLVRDRSECD